MKKPIHKEKRFFGVFETFKEYENYIAREEEPTLNFLDDMAFLNKSRLILLAENCKGVRKN